MKCFPYVVQEIQGKVSTSTKNLFLSLLIDQLRNLGRSVGGKLA
jgi:hypothetical protein